MQNSSQIRPCLCSAGGAQAPEGGGKIIRLRGGRQTQGNNLPDNTGPLHIWTHRDNDSAHRHAKPQATKIPALRWGSGHGSPLLTKKLSALTPAGTGQVQRPATECHWVYQPHQEQAPCQHRLHLTLGTFLVWYFLCFDFTRLFWLLAGYLVLHCVYVEVCV